MNRVLIDLDVTVIPNRCQALLTAGTRTLTYGGNAYGSQASAAIVLAGPLGLVDVQWEKRNVRLAKAKAEMPDSPFFRFGHSLRPGIGL
jgi:hypothetical protein